jgi:hypothetical protein
MFWPNSCVPPNFCQLFFHLPIHPSSCCLSKRKRRKRTTTTKKEHQNRHTHTHKHKHTYTQRDRETERVHIETVVHFNYILTQILASAIWAEFFWGQQDTQPLNRRRSMPVATKPLLEVEWQHQRLATTLGKCLLQNAQGLSSFERPNLWKSPSGFGLNLGLCPREPFSSSSPCIYS